MHSQKADKRIFRVPANEYVLAGYFFGAWLMM
jgi:hypothetical protein